MPLLDSDILIDFLRGDSKVIEKINTLSKESIHLSVSSITALELFQGAYGHSKADAKVNQVENFLNRLEILPFEKLEGKIASKIADSLRRQGKLIDLPDILIAATALARNEKIITRNARDFSRISGLIVEKW